MLFSHLLDQGPQTFKPMGNFGILTQGVMDTPTKWLSWEVIPNTKWLLQEVILPAPPHTHIQRKPKCSE